jgi:hypothetical protein
MEKGQRAYSSRNKEKNKKEKKNVVPLFKFLTGAKKETFRGIIIGTCSFTLFSGLRNEWTEFLY